MNTSQQKNTPIGNIGERVKALRESLCLNQTQFAEKIDVKQAFISKVEKNNASFTIDHIILLKNIFSVDISWLLTGEGEMKRSQPVTVADKPEGFRPILLDADRRRGLLHDKLQRVLDEGDKTKIEAIKGMLKAFDPGEKKQDMDCTENEGTGAARNRAA